VAGAFAQAVDGAFDLARAFLQCGQRVRYGETEIVVAMDAQHDVVDALDLFLEVTDGGGVLTGHGVADRVGDVDGRGAGGDGLFDDFGEEVQLGAGCVFGREFD